MNVGSAVSLLKKTYSKWSDRQGPRLGASVAFYTLLSFAPLLVLTVAVIGLVFDQQRAQTALIDQARHMIGDRGADTVKALLLNARKPSSGLMASIIAFVTLLFGASGVFAELRDALNIIWDAEPTNEPGLLGLIKQRLFSFGMVLSVGFLLLVSLIISAGLALLGKFFSQLLPLPASVFEVVDFFVSFIVIAVLFALLFKFVPAREISWRDVTVGAIGTAILFTFGKFLLGFYLGKASVGSAYGTAGSLVAVIVWVYYSAQLFFFGAEFARVYADVHAGAALRDDNRKAAGNQDSASRGRSRYAAAASSHNRSRSDYPTRSVSNEQKIETAQVKTLPEAENKRTAAAAIGGIEASSALMGGGRRYAPSTNGGESMERKSRYQILSAAVSGFLVLRALATKHRHRDPGS